MSSKLWHRSYTSLIASNCLMTIAFNMFTGLIPLYVQRFGADNSVVGSMAAAYGLVLMLSKPVTGAMIDRTNRRKFLVVSSALFTLNIALYMMTRSIGFLFFLRLLSGVTNGLFIVTSSTIVSLIVADDRLEDAISYYRISASLSSSASPVIGAAIYRGLGFGAVFGTMFALAAGGLALMCLVREKDVPPLGELPPFSARQAFALRNILEFSVLSVSLTAFFFYTSTSSTKDYLVAFGETVGVHSISFFFLSSSLFMLLSRVVHRLIGKKVSEKAVLTIGGALMSGCYLIVPAVRSTLGAVSLGAVFGLAEGLTTPLLNAMALRRAPLNRKGTASATFSMVTGLGTSLGGDLWGKLSASFGYPIIYRGASLTSLLGTAAVWILLRR